MSRESSHVTAERGTNNRADFDPRLHSKHALKSRALFLAQILPTEIESRLRRVVDMFTDVIDPSHRSESSPFRICSLQRTQTGTLLQRCAYHPPSHWTHYQVTPP